MENGQDESVRRIQVMMDEFRSIRQQFIRRVFSMMAIILGVIFGSIFAFNFITNFFGNEQHLLMIAEMITMIHCYLIAMIVKSCQFDLTKPFGLSLNNAIMYITGAIALILTIILSSPITQKMFAFSLITFTYLTWVFALLSQIVFGGRSVSMPIGHYGRSAIMLSITMVTIFLYVLMVLQIIIRQHLFYHLFISNEYEYDYEDMIIENNSTIYVSLHEK
ncbi:hypothetical protein BLOT_003123 [Blomia tropicalis]|nr:hypothetical protein BLOT_003123 [Blomia tropicalis]